jgi:hypothetical protein
MSRRITKTVVAAGVDALNGFMGVERYRGLDEKGVEAIFRAMVRHESASDVGQALGDRHSQNGLKTRSLPSPGSEEHRVPLQGP